MEYGDVNIFLAKNSELIMIVAHNELRGETYKPIFT
jgi:hypothetical protein